MNRGVEVGEALLGSCQSIADALGEDEQHLVDNMEFCKALDGTAMLCDCCGWWVEPEEIDDNGDCEQCQGDKDE
jgi:hypothetical protein